MVTKTIAQAAALLPLRLKSELLILDSDKASQIEEIRLRTGCPMNISICGIEYPIADDYIICADDLEGVLECATEASFHSVEHELARGYISVKGGIRVGVCGTAVIKNGEVCALRNVSSLSIRIPRQFTGLCDDLFGRLYGERANDLLIIAPPGGGKTSCLREYVRYSSDHGKRVSLADEKGEIAAVYDGEPQFDVGTHTDIICDAPKAKAVMMLIKSMTPDIVALDEISSDEDAQAIFEAYGCGVSIAATAHARCTDDLYRRRTYAKLMDAGIFDYCIEIENKSGKREYKLKKLCT